MRGHIGKMLGAAGVAVLLLASPAGASTRNTNFRRDLPVQPPASLNTPSFAEPSDPTPVGPPGYADFRGQTIDLSQGWGAAKACAAFANGATNCYPTVAAMKAALTILAPPPSGSTALTPQSAPEGVGPSAPQARRRAALLRRHALTATRTHLVGHASYCQGQSWEWVYLYENANFGGRVLALQDTGFWYTLSNYGFASTMSSWFNGSACTAYGAQNFSGGIWVMLSPWSASAWVGYAANDKVNYLYIG